MLTVESGVSDREILRFLGRDVMKARALFPCGNKADIVNRFLPPLEQ